MFVPCVVSNLKPKKLWIPTETGRDDEFQERNLPKTSLLVVASSPQWLRFIAGQKRGSREGAS
jgi:hypothetical protein